LKTSRCNFGRQNKTWQELFLVHEIGRIDGGNVFRIGRIMFYDQKNKIPFKIPAGKICLGLLLKPYWSSKYLSYFPVYYHLTLLYCLPFVTTFLLLLEECNIERYQWYSFPEWACLCLALALLCYAALHAYKALNPKGKLSNIFATAANRNRLSYESTDKEII
jgi:hypothetical protein